MSDFASTKAYQKAMEWRDWQTCDLIAEEHQTLVKEISTLKLALKEFAEAVVYAESQSRYFVNIATAPDVFMAAQHSGDKFRETLSKHKELLESINGASASNKGEWV